MMAGMARQSRADRMKDGERRFVVAKEKSEENLRRKELGREIGAKVEPKRKGGQEKIKGKVLGVRGFSCVCLCVLTSAKHP